MARERKRPLPTVPAGLRDDAIIDAHIGEVRLRLLEKERGYILVFDRRRPPPKGQKRFAIDLTEQTEQEIQTLREVLNEVIDMALPICIERDNATRLDPTYELYDAIDIERRHYRELPRVLRSERKP